jgi:hypothetical protein
MYFMYEINEINKKLTVHNMVCKYIVSKPSKHQNMLYDFSICFILLCKMNERLYDMTPNRMMLDVSVSTKK